MRHAPRLASRLFRRGRALAFAAVLTLSLGVGAVTTAFALFHGILLSPLDYPEPDRLVRLYQRLESLKRSPNPRLAAIWNRLPLSYLDTVDLRRRSRTLAEIGLYEGYTAVLAGGREPEEVAAARVEPELLRALGVEAHLGRVFAPEEAARRERLVLLGHDLWQAAFGADAGIVGRAVRLNGEPYTVVGVMPRGFTLPGRSDRLWTPLVPTDDDLAIRDEQRYAALARLAPGASVEGARDELRRFAADLAGEYPEIRAGASVRLVPLLSTVVGESERFLRLLGAAAAVVLLVAAVNVSHLLFARGLDRRRDLAVRLCLGAGRLRLLRAQATEVLVIALAGGFGGLLLAGLATRGLKRLLAAELPRLGEVAVDGGVALFALAVGLFAALLAGLLPAIRASDVSLREVVGETAHGGRTSLGRRALVTIEVALTMTLASSAALLAVAWVRLAKVDPGFVPGGVLVQEVHLPDWRYPDGVDRRRAADRIVAAIERLPGVRAVALTNRPPVAGPAEVWGFRIAGRDPPGEDWTRGRTTTMQFATPGYFRLLGIPLLAGRLFAVGDEALDRREVVVAATLAARHWPAGNALGAEVILGQDPQPYTVVGVVADVRHQGPADEPGELMIQSWSRRPAGSMAILVAVAGHPLDRAAAVRGAIHGIDPDLALPQTTELAELVDQSLSGPRTRALFSGLSAGVALLLAAVGVGGVVAHDVGRRRRETGIRMALGADRRRVRRAVLIEALAPALGGVAVGAVGAVGAGRLLEAQLSGITAWNPVILAGVGLLLLATCAAAAYPPALAASRTEPARTLAAE